MKATHLIIALTTLLPTLASAVEYKPYSEQQPALQTVEAPAPVFQSTSNFAGSGSPLITTPMLNADGSASYEGAASSAQVSSGPNRIAPMKPEGDPTPVGDGLWVLLVMAISYASWKLRRRGANRY